MIIAAFTFLLGANALSAPGETCANLGSAIEGNLKEIAMQRMDDIADNSAPRATTRELKINNAWIEIQLDYTLSQQNHCPPRTEPFGYGAYFASAMACATAHMKGDYKADACDRAKWGAQPTSVPASPLK